MFTNELHMHLAAAVTVKLIIGALVNSQYSSETTLSAPDQAREANQTLVTGCRAFKQLLILTIWDSVYSLFTGKI